MNVRIKRLNIILKIIHYFVLIYNFEIFNSYTGVAVWKWVANDDTCGICRMPFDSCCTDCKYPGDDCPLVWGQCSHCL